MAVYDKEKKSGGQGTLAGDSVEELERITGITGAEKERIHRNAAEGAADDILARERQAAAPGTSGTGEGAEAGEAAEGTTAKKAEANSRSELKEKEEEGFFNPGSSESSSGGGKSGVLGKLIGNIKAKKAQRYAAAAIISGLIGAGGAASIGGIASGPLQFIQLEHLFDAFHMEAKGDQVDGRLTNLARYVRYYQQGKPQNSRLGFLGNKIADRAEARFNKIGLTSTYTEKFGFISGYEIDRDKVRGGAFDKLDPTTRNNPEAFADFMEKEFGVRPTIGPDGTMRIDADKMSNKDFTRFSRQIQRASGASKITSRINARFAGVRAGYTRWHPIKALDRKVLKTVEARYTKWKEDRKEAASKGSAAVRPGEIDKEQQDVKDENGNTTKEDVPGTQEREDKITETAGEAGEAHNSEEGKAKLKASITEKIGGGTVALAGAVEILCLLMMIYKNIDQTNFQNIILPAQRVGMELMSVGSQIEFGGPDLEGKASGLEQMSWYGAALSSKANGDTAFEAESINSELGRPGGKKAPDEIRTDGQNILSKMFDKIEGVVEPACKVVNSVLGQIFLTIAGIASGPVSAAVGFAFGVIAMPKIIDWVVTKLSATEIDTDTLAGADLGNVANYGVRHFANNQAIGNGGLPLTEPQAAELQQTTEELDNEEFQEKSLAYKLFSPEDPRSLMGQIVQQQDTDPAANVAKYAGSFLNIGHSFASLIGKQFQLATVGAAPVRPYDYGFDDYGFTAAEMEDQRYKNPYDNADKAVALLNGDQGEDFVKRAKKCFGIDISKQEATDQEDPGAMPVEVWAINKPKDGQIPLYKVTKEADCMDHGEDWTRIRFFIMDSQAMNAYYCYEGQANGDLTKQACKDAGMAAGGGGGNGKVKHLGLSGLDWNSGAYGGVIARVHDWETYRGTAADSWTTFSTRNSWPSVVTPEGDWNNLKGFEGYVVMSQPLWPEGQGNLAACASGAYDSQWSQYGTSSANSEFAGRIITRVGWEFNGNWFWWRADNPDQWIQCFQHISTAIKSTDPSAIIDWSANSGSSAGMCGGSVYNCYPGDEYVDVVSIDHYSSYGRSNWEANCATPDGLCGMFNFAKEHGKQFGVGEWGVTTCGGSPSGDAPDWVQHMHDFFQENAADMAYENYFQDMLPNNVCSDISKGAAPASSGVYKQNWGPQ